VAVVQHLGRRVLLFSQWTRAMDLIADYLDVRRLQLQPKLQPHFQLQFQFQSQFQVQAIL
jgi:SNF2 family DNA or RNA helicase